MTKRIVKNIIAVLIVAFLAYNSVYFKKLDEVKASATKQFNAAAYARTYMDTKLIPAANTAPYADKLLPTIKADATKGFKNYAHAASIGNIRYFMVQGKGKVLNIDENDVYLLTPGKQTIKIATEYVFGNALRDAPGIININDFTNTMDLNNIAAEVDKIVRAEVLPSFKTKVKKGDNITFAGAFELNQEHVNLDNIEVIPVSLKIIK
jgi:predicted lipoprotein